MVGITSMGDADLYQGGFTIERISTSNIRIDKLIRSLQYPPTEWNEGTKEKNP